MNYVFNGGISRYTMGEATQTVATFTGTLLQRQRAEGKPFVQLIFREAGKDWLCLSSNIARVAQLQIGKTYKIQGIFKALGDRQYIHEPEIVLTHSRVEHLRRWGLYVGIVLMVATITALAVRAVHGSLRFTSAETAGNHTQTHVTTKTNQPAKPATTDTTTTPATDTPAPTPTPAPKPAPKKATTAPVVTPPAAPNPTPVTPVVPPPAPDCDYSVVTKHYGQGVPQYDPTQPEGTVVTPGVDELSTVCYPNGRNQPGVPTVTTQEQDEVVTTQIPPATPPTP